MEDSAQSSNALQGELGAEASAMNNHQLPIPLHPPLPSPLVSQNIFSIHSPSAPLDRSWSPSQSTPSPLPAIHHSFGDNDTTVRSPSEPQLTTPGYRQTQQPSDMYERLEGSSGLPPLYSFAPNSQAQLSNSRTLPIPSPELPPSYVHTRANPHGSIEQAIYQGSYQHPPIWSSAYHLPQSTSTTLAGNYHRDTHRPSSFFHLPLHPSNPEVPRHLGTTQLPSFGSLNGSQLPFSDGILKPLREPSPVSPSAYQQHGPGQEVPDQRQAEPESGTDNRPFRGLATPIASLQRVPPLDTDGHKQQPCTSPTLPPTLSQEEHAAISPVPADNPPLLITPPHAGDFPSADNHHNHENGLLQQRRRAMDAYEAARSTLRENRVYRERLDAELDTCRRLVKQAEDEFEQLKVQTARTSNDRDDPSIRSALPTKFGANATSTASTARTSNLNSTEQDQHRDLEPSRWPHETPEAFRLTTLQSELSTLLQKEFATIEHETKTKDNLKLAEKNLRNVDARIDHHRNHMSHQDSNIVKSPLRR